MARPFEGPKFGVTCRRRGSRRGPSSLSSIEAALPRHDERSMKETCGCLNVRPVSLVASRLKELEQAVARCRRRRFEVLAAVVRVHRLNPAPPGRVPRGCSLGVQPLTATGKRAATSNTDSRRIWARREGEGAAAASAASRFHNMAEPSNRSEFLFLVRTWEVTSRRPVQIFSRTPPRRRRPVGLDEQHLRLRRFKPLRCQSKLTPCR
jgi:hypothetical protein